MGSTTTQFVYDQAGHLLEEADGSGTVQKEYIWLDNMPVALVDDTWASPVVYFIHTDQIGTPQKLTDGSANVVWDGSFDPFGNAVSGTGGPLMNLRFPGQYFDVDSNLHQNWLRAYDPDIGRYIQSDILGISVGINTYSYVHGNPVINVDPFGLWQVMISGGADFGGSITFGYNSGQWNIGLWAGAGEGFSWRVNPWDTGCQQPGFQGSFKGQTNWRLATPLGLTGGSLGIQFRQPGIYANGSVSMGGGLNMSASTGGPPTVPPAMPISRTHWGPTWGGGSSVFFGAGGTYTW